MVRCTCKVASYEAHRSLNKFWAPPVCFLFKKRYKLQTKSNTPTCLGSFGMSWKAGVINVYTLFPDLDGVRSEPLTIDAPLSVAKLYGLVKTFYQNLAEHEKHSTSSTAEYGDLLARCFKWVQVGCLEVQNVFWRWDPESLHYSTLIWTGMK